MQVVARIKTALELFRIVVTAHRLVEMEIVFRSETLRGDFVVSRSIPGPAAADGSPTFLHRVSDPAGRDHVLAQTRWRPR